MHRWNDGYRSHEIYFRYDTRYIIDRWNLDVSSSRRGDGQKRVPNDVLNFLNLKAGGVVRTYLPNIGRLLEY